MTFTIGLIALALGLVFDWQRLFPKLGDRIAAVCALTVGAAWLAGGQVGSWADTAATKTARVIGDGGHKLTTDVPTSSGSLILGVVIGVWFLIWLLAMLPGYGLVTKHISPRAKAPLTSGLIWGGVAFPPFIYLVPGWWGDIAHSLVFFFADLGATFSGWVLS